MPLLHLYCQVQLIQLLTQLIQLLTLPIEPIIHHLSQAIHRDDDLQEQEHRLIVVGYDW